MSRLLALAVLLLAVGQSHAGPCEIMVEVTDGMEPLPAATVIIVTEPEHVLVDTRLSDSEGRVVFGNLVADNSYWVRVSFMGFIDLAVPVICRGDSTVLPAALVEDWVFRESDTRVSESMLDWYREFIAAMKEPYLWELGQGERLPVFRFLYLRSFDRPISVRLAVLGDGRGEVTVKVLKGMGGYKPGKLIRNSTSVISAGEVARFLNLLDEFDFWNLGPEHRMGLDGAEWILQGVDGDRFQSVSRWSPKSGLFRQAALMLLGFAQIKVDPIY